MPMPEIRFSDSLEKTRKYMKELLVHPMTGYKDRCDECREWQRGIYQVTTGNFVCVNCLAREYFERLVGKPEE